MSPGGYPYCWLPFDLLSNVPKQQCGSASKQQCVCRHFVLSTNPPCSPGRTVSISLQTAPHLHLGPLEHLQLAKRNEQQQKDTKTQLTSLFKCIIPRPQLHSPPPPSHAPAACTTAAEPSCMTLPQLHTSSGPSPPPLSAATPAPPAVPPWQLLHTLPHRMCSPGLPGIQGSGSGHGLETKQGI